jgi:hypothetical protein
MKNEEGRKKRIGLAFNLQPSTVFLGGGGIRKRLTWMAAWVIFIKIIHGWFHGVIAGLVHTLLQPQGARKRSLNPLNAGGDDEPAD